MLFISRMMDGHHISNRKQLVKEISQVQVAVGWWHIHGVAEGEKSGIILHFCNSYVLLNRKQLCSSICSYSYSAAVSHLVRLLRNSATH